MIGLLKGIVEDVNEKEILLLTSGGVGYQIRPAGSLLARCKKGASLTAEVLTVVRENEITLYGFGDSSERRLFEKLISVSGIGPKTALQMVSIPADKFMMACENGDVSFLTQIPGLGKKTAERLIVELRGKLDLKPKGMPNIPSNEAFIEAREALENLGYDARTIHKVLSDAPEDSSAEELVKRFLSSNA
ncbi:Holliday junction branch migration protein RuvA [Candidatus Gracilibacteria bacterium]|nr:Holliday junction branch migration protein RuvA [Candidatus Gracilibacteria bacterium]MCF7819347.1 Holliday junction branch migration protein RuvA [Candidatus Gracilibacteria bacterium]